MIIYDMLPCAQVSTIIFQVNQVYQNNQILNQVVNNSKILTKVTHNMSFQRMTVKFPTSY